MQVTPQGDVATVTVHLCFHAPPPDAGEGEGPSEADINEGIRAALQSIENQLTGQGGKVEPPAAREAGADR